MGLIKGLIGTRKWRNRIGCSRCPWTFKHKDPFRRLDAYRDHVDVKHSNNI